MRVASFVRVEIESMVKGSTCSGAKMCLSQDDVMDYPRWWRWLAKIVDVVSQGAHDGRKRLRKLNGKEKSPSDSSLLGVSCNACFTSAGKFNWLLWTAFCKIKSLIHTRTNFSVTLYSLRT